MNRTALGVVLTTVLAIGGGRAGAESPDAASEGYFELKVRPVLAGTCVKCHGEQKASGGLRLDSREAMLTGRRYGGPEAVFRVGSLTASFFHAYFASCPAAAAALFMPAASPPT